MAVKTETDDFLHDAQAVLVAHQRSEVLQDVVEEFLANAARVRVALDNQDDHVVTLVVLRQLQDVLFLEDDASDDGEFDILGGRHEHLLQDPRALLVAADLDELAAGYLLEEVHAALQSETLDERRAEVVAVLADHEVGQLAVQLIDDLLDELFARTGNNILQEQRADLLRGQFNDVALEYFKLSVGVLFSSLQVALNLAQEVLKALLV